MSQLVSYHLNADTLLRPREHTLSSMVDKTYLVCLQPPSEALERVAASRFETRGKHLVFVGSRGKPAALFLMELVESWGVLSDCEAL